MDISNKTLAMFLVAAIVASIAGTMISLNKLGAIEGPTGYVPHDYTGNVTINITEELSITISTDTVIDFGSCSPLPGQIAFITSENNAAAVTACQNTGSLPDFFTILNDGNVDANVTINVSDIGYHNFGSGAGTFLANTNSDESYIAYSITDTTSCTGFPAAGYHNFTDASLAWQGCDNLTFRSGDKDFQFDIGIGLPADATPGQGQETLTVTFWGQQA